MNQTVRIIFNPQEIKAIVAKAKKNGQKVVLTQGSCDLVHIGHARYCEKAKSFGDLLIVGADSDQKVRARKGDNRPIVPQDERMEMLTHLRSVDYVVLKELGDPKFNLIKAIKPDILVATKKTYDAATIRQLETICGKIVVLEPMATTRTTGKIRLMQMKTANSIKNKMSSKLISTIEDVLAEFKED